MKPTISVVISAFNEEVKLPRCLTAVSWANEILVVDGSSTDKTAAIARKHKATVFTRPNNLMLNVNKNYGFAKATGDWVLSLDADEVVSEELKNEILTAVSGAPSISGYWMPRKNILFGKWIRHGIWWPDKQLRLFRRGNGKFPCKHVHEYLEVEGQTTDLTNTLTHYNYESISQFLHKLDAIYTVNEVERHIATGYRVAWYDAIRFPASDFLKTYFAQSGYRDGLHGLVLSMLQAFYSLVVFAKLWERESFIERDVPYKELEREMKKTAREFSYWMITAKLKQSGFPASLMLRILRKIAFFPGQ